MDRLGLHSGTVFNYHQQRRQTKDYLKDLELLQYDILYGDQYVYNGKPPITEGHMQMGIKEVTLTDLVENLDETYSLYGTNFTKWSKVYINDEKQESTFLNNTRIELPDSKLKDGDIITVSQVGSSNTIFRTSREYIYMDGKILEYTDEVKNRRILQRWTAISRRQKMPDSPENSRIRIIKKKRAGSSRVPLKKDGKDCEV